MTFNDIEKALDRGARNLVFITKPHGKSFMVWNYSGNSYINTFLSRFDVWGKSSSCSKLYKGKFEYTGFELPIELYDVFKLPSVKLAFDRDGCNMFFEEELEVTMKDTVMPKTTVNTIGRIAIQDGAIIVYDLFANGKPTICSIMVGSNIKENQYADLMNEVRNNLSNMIDILNKSECVKHIHINYANKSLSRIDNGRMLRCIYDYIKARNNPHWHVIEPEIKVYEV